MAVEGVASVVRRNRPGTKADVSKQVFVYVILESECW